ncbi:MAG TPA: peptidoglycan-binding domain-containing protein, partial [Noviherbaspirillum sp.]
PQRTPDMASDATHEDKESRPASDPPADVQTGRKQNPGASTALRHEQDALRQLMQLWGMPPASTDPCDAAAEANVLCHRGHGGLAELRQLDRPAVLVMYDKADKPFYAILTALDGTRATLRAGDAVQHIGLVELTRHFRGEFVMLWRAPVGFSKPVTLGDAGPAVDWIQAQLAKLSGGVPPASDQPFGQKAMKQLRQFQQASGLFVDGIAGPVTAMHLNRVAGVEEPHLRGDTAAPTRPVIGE